jgi:hypothetical protein
MNDNVELAELAKIILAEMQASGRFPDVVGVVPAGTTPPLGVLEGPTDTIPGAVHPLPNGQARTGESAQHSLISVLPSPGEPPGELIGIFPP